MLRWSGWSLRHWKCCRWEVLCWSSLHYCQPEAAEQKGASCDLGREPWALLRWPCFALEQSLSVLGWVCKAPLPASSKSWKAPACWISAFFFFIFPSLMWWMLAPDILQIPTFFFLSFSLSISHLEVGLDLTWPRLCIRGIVEPLGLSNPRLLFPSAWGFSCSVPGLECFEKCSVNCLGYFEGWSFKNMYVAATLRKVKHFFSALDLNPACCKRCELLLWDVWETG